MLRNSRVVAIGYPHHITQRGNNREPVFCVDENRQYFLNLFQKVKQNGGATIRFCRWLDTP